MVSTENNFKLISEIITKTTITVIVQTTNIAHLYFCSPKIFLTQVKAWSMITILTSTQTKDFFLNIMQQFFALKTLKLLKLLSSLKQDEFW